MQDELRRVIIIVMDSFGIGGAPDAQKFGDLGANTFGHIAQWCADGNQSDVRKHKGTLNLPNLSALGLAHAAEAACGTWPDGFDKNIALVGNWGHAKEISNGKDTPSGHWEIAGLPVLFDWGYFPKTIPCFSEELIADIINECAKHDIHFAGILGNKHASGTEIIKEFGEQHCATKLPIFYTSSDSVLQIAAHEDFFGLENLYKLCEIARKRLDGDMIGRIIARPFLGDGRDTYSRTGNRRDFSMQPHGDTLLTRVVDKGNATWAIGKVADIYAHKGISHQIKATGHEALMAKTCEAMDRAQSGDLIFTNFVEFDQSFGHRRDVAGYANALEEFDAMMPQLFTKMRTGDRIIFTADHGCDPTYKGTEHTREQVPILVAGHDLASQPIGERKTFADIGESIAHYLHLPPLGTGTVFKL